MLKRVTTKRLFYILKILQRLGYSLLKYLTAISILLIICFGLYCLYLLYANFSSTDYAKDSLLGDYISSIVLVFTAGVAIGLTWLELKQNRNEAKKDRDQSARTAEETAMRRATLDMITKTEFDKEFIDAKVTFQNYTHKKNGELEKLFARVQHCIRHKMKVDKKEHEDMTDIRVFFNSFELVALGIQKGVLDEEFYKKWQATSFIAVWNRSAITIGIMRRAADNNKIYLQWEEQVKHWASLPEFEGTKVEEAECDLKKYQEYSNSVKNKMKKNRRNKKTGNK